MRSINIAIISGSQNTSQYLARQLSDLLGKYLSFVPFSKEEWVKNETDYDLILLSTQTIFTHQPLLKVKTSLESMVIRRTLLKSSWDKVLSIQSGSKWLLYNDERESAEETVSLLYELGARHIELIPAFPSMEKIPSITSAITPNEYKIIPPNITEVINIGERVIDVSTIVDILTRFDLLQEDTQHIVSDYTKKIITRSQGLHVTMEGLIKTTKVLQQTVNMVQDAVIAYDHQKNITIFNKAAEEIFALSSWEVAGRDILSLFHDEKLTRETLDTPFTGVPFIIRNQQVIMNHISIENGEVETVSGGVLILQVAKKLEELELKIRTKLKTSGHQAKYTFQDIITESEEMMMLIDMAKKMAQSDLNVLILGESGTGKELFAHSIHQYSTRAAFPFVAVNCSALSESLLESELFGYEEGAFTGARKGGKPGLFEQAHRGTIFLDEIGDISLSFQKRLLRVLQQREVLRVGGTKVIPIDVRVISATNRNLLDFVKEGKFRADLYYRLKVLPLSIPPLRERGKDILQLANFFLRRNGWNKNLSAAVSEVFLQYHWPGNIRELQNTMEYLSIMNNGHITTKDLPFLDSLAYKPMATTNVDKPLSEFSKLSKEDLSLFILQSILSERQKGRSIGRRGLWNIAQQRTLLTSETEIRILLKELHEKQWIKVGKGRQGCHITEKGLYQLQNGVNGINRM
ncbi:MULTISPECIES: sigma-54-dependent Fis family transcriptional regulator [unclassified Peribacillus]|uniref:sigma-54 interaction domain-containing protein n=1 Tax=unclassified Peribacillus TaxID=2675266 RepID=UPI001911D859|nr:MULTISPECIES: sigma 54-interacting transcriptional regulator [unclassified Peribacillus]MBK5441731.1 sigma 54-interacting transcriptional regulator [Peribacillus sp. TH24]MBK5458348.1 sigma 54-interacting transcriptional regulator [Peribacillus sp. TH27]